MVEEIEITHSKITDHSIEILTKYLHGNTTFKKLGIGYNDRITSKSTLYLKNIIESSCIIDVDIAGTSITPANVLVVKLAYNIIKYGSKKFELRDK